MTNKSKQTNKSSSPEAASAAESDDERSKVLCSIILDRLQKQDVVWVRIADPHLRVVDDLQISTKSRIDAYLVHWSEWPDTLTLEDLTSDDDDKPCMVRQLAEGWQRLSKQYRLPVTVHLLTNDQPSAKKIEGADKCHLAKFIATEWKKNERDAEGWSKIWSKILTASGLTEEQFDEFVGCCKFDFSYSRPELDEEADEYQPFYWVEHIYETLFEHEDHSTLPIELNHAELLQLLGWRREQSRQILKLPKGEPGVGITELSSVADQDLDEVSRPAEPIDSAALSSIRGASAGAWLQAANDSESEVADWLKAGSEPGDSGSEDVVKRSPSSFIGNKQGKEKRSWKDLAEQEKQTPGPRRFNEPGENRSADADSQRITGKLRSMLGSLPPPPEDDEDADVESEEEVSLSSVDQELEQEVVPKPEEADSEALVEGEAEPEAEQVAEPVSEEEEEEEEEESFTSAQLDAIQVGAREEIIEEEVPASDKGAQNELDFSPAEDATSEPVEDAASEDEQVADAVPENAGAQDAFSKISRLAKKQEGIVDVDEEASLDAFNWYFDNGNELFEASRFEDAALEYNRALELVAKLEWQNKQDQEFVILQNLGDIYMFLDKPEQAVELYERTKEQRFTARVPASKYIAALIKLGTYYEDNNCFSDAEKEYRKAVEVAAEFLEKDDPILVRLNEACLNLARNRSTLMSRFSSTEVERIREMAKQEVDVAIMYRKKKSTETEIEQPDIWMGRRKPEDGEEPPAPPSSKQKWLMASGAVAVVFVFAFAILVPHGVTPGALLPNGSDPHGVYSSADGQKVIELDKGGQAKYTHNGQVQKATYSFISDTITDLLPLIPGHLRAKYTFFRSSDSAIIESSGTHFYTHDAPELKLVKRMWKYAELAQGYRHEKNFYPESNEAWSIAKDKLTFLNPVTGKSDEAIVFSTTGEATDTPVRTSIAAGEAWKGQPESGPGKIICNVYNGRMFFLRAWDKDNKLLTSGDKGTCFYIECSDGVDVTSDRLKELAREGAPAAEKDGKQIRFVFAASPFAEANFQLILSAVPCALLAFVLLALAVWRYRVNKKIAGPLSLGACIITTMLLLGWYAIAIMS